MTGTALEQAQATDLQARQALNRDIAVARQLNASSLLRKDLQGEKNLPDAQAIAITLHQYGIPVGIQNMNACFVVNGRVDFMTRIWTALAHRGGYRVWPDDASDSQTGIAHILNTATGEEHTVTFTWEDAQKANLTGSDTYKRYGRDMLIWRAMSRAVRWHAPEVVAGMAEVDDAPVSRPRPRPIPAAAYQPEPDDDDITDAELVPQGEDIRMVTQNIGPVTVGEPLAKGEATAAPPGPAHDVPGAADPAFQRPTNPPEVVGDEQPEIYVKRCRRANAVMGEVGVKEADARHQLVHAATGGATASTARLTAWQVEAIVSFCDRLKADQTPGGGVDNGGDDRGAPAVPTSSGPVDWRALAKQHEIKDGPLLLKMREFAGQLGQPLPSDLDEVDEETIDYFVDWVTGE